jgi:hypothetical protein
MVAGLQVPVIPSSDVAGNKDGDEPTHSVAIAGKVGVMLSLTLTVKVVVVAH